MPHQRGQMNSRLWNLRMRAPTISLLFFSLSSLLAHSARATLDDTKTQIATLLPKPPIIDGVIDAAEWERASSWEVTVDPTASDGIRGGSTADPATLPVDNNDLSY